MNADELMCGGRFLSMETSILHKGKGMVDLYYSLDWTTGPFKEGPYCIHLVSTGLDDFNITWSLNGIYQY